VRPEPSNAAYACPTCGFELWLPLVRLDVSTLGLYNDARFPGRSILALHEHYDDLGDVEPDLLARFILDVRRSGRAIKTAARADRMNYAVLGNVEPHVHFHLIPRVRANDSVPNRPPWEHPLPVSPLPADKIDLLSRAIIDLVLANPTAAPASASQRSYG
jgi:diadenosine tetraphosphate (Ap4A) HIT family hydrolase